MQEQTHMYDHFTRIAGNYRGVRTTDAAPIEYIRDALAARGKIVAADIGCGAGRYDLSLFRYLDNLRLTSQRGTGRQRADAVGNRGSETGHTAPPALTPRRRRPAPVLSVPNGR